VRPGLSSVFVSSVLPGFHNRLSNSKSRVPLNFLKNQHFNFNEIFPFINLRSYFCSYIRFLLGQYKKGAAPYRFSSNRQKQEILSRKKSIPPPDKVIFNSPPACRKKKKQTPTSVFYKLAKNAVKVLHFLFYHAASGSRRFSARVYHHIKIYTTTGARAETGPAIF